MRFLFAGRFMLENTSSISMHVVSGILGSDILLQYNTYMRSKKARHSQRVDSFHREPVHHIPHTVRVFRAHQSQTL